MFLVFTTVFLLGLVISTVQHFISLEEPCFLASSCNHTWIKECGFDRNNSVTRIFLDECDRLEYNCDHKKEYIKTNISECKTDDVVNIKTTPSNVTIATRSVEMNTLTMSTNESTTLTSFNNTSDVTSVTTNDFDTKTIEDAVMSTICTETANNANFSCVKNVTHTTETPITSHNATTLPTTTTIESTTKQSTATASSSITTPTVLTKLSNTNTTSPKNTTTTTELTPKKSNFTVTTEVNTRSEAVTTTLTTSTEGHTTVTTSPCSRYPRDCDRPVTWETTSEGETRDFFRILKERFGR